MQVVSDYQEISWCSVGRFYPLRSRTIFVMILHTKIIYQICVDIRALRGAPRISEVHRYLLETYRNGSIYVERQDCIDFMFLSFFNDLKIYIRIFQRYRRLKSAAPIARQTCTTYTYLSSYLCLYAIGEKKPEEQTATPMKFCTRL